MRYTIYVYINGDFVLGVKRWTMAGIAKAVYDYEDLCINGVVYDRSGNEIDKFYGNFLDIP